VNFEFFLDKVNGVGSLWWLPVFFWFAYFFWCRSLDYPADLEKHIKNGKSWPYLPKFWKAEKRKLIRVANYLLFWLGNLFCACSLYYLFPYEHVVFLIIGMALSMFIEIKIRSFGTKDIIRLQQDRYFQIYTQLANQAVSKGNEVSDSELLSRTQWQHQNDLRLADKQGRLMEFLRGEAKL
jgi:hypothetical protein